MPTIAEQLSTRIINAGSSIQQSNRFNVRFLGMPDNISDFLSRQVKNVTLPAITFQTMQHNSRRAQFQDIGKIESEVLSITLAGDDEGIADAIMTTQLFRQKGEEISGFVGVKNDSKFDVKIEYINTRGDVVRFETYQKCFISSLQKPDLDNSEAGANALYTMTLQYDSIKYSLEDNNLILNV